MPIRVPRTEEALSKYLLNEWMNKQIIEILAK